MHSLVSKVSVGLLLATLATACTPAAPDTTAQRDLVHQWAGALDANDFDALRAMITEDFLLDYVGSPELMDIEQSVSLIRDFYAAFPDYTHQVDEIIAEGTSVAARMTYRGTQTGDFEGIPASGKAIEYVGVHVLTLENGKIRRAWVLEDMLGMMIQLGMTLAPAGTEP